MGLFSRSVVQENETSKSSFPPPPGRRRALPLLGQTLSFHDAAHDEVTSIVEATGSSSVRLNVITRNVAIVTTYEDAYNVLNQEWDAVPPVSRSQAYEQLMAAFYSAPNLLLEDEDSEGAKEHRQCWNESIEQAMQGDTVRARVENIVAKWVDRITGSSGEIELYDACKDLGHDLALGTFLSLDISSAAGDASHDKLRTWSEEMLRGQFTLPVGLNVGFFQNTFSRGQAAKVQFDTVVEKQLLAESRKQQCPFAVNPRGQLSDASLVSHHSMFASSLVVKAFASLATVLLLQLYRHSGDGKGTLARQLNSTDQTSFDSVLESIITETERLSPPIIGVMRRVTSSRGVDLPSSSTNVPSGWDVWPYFPLANRDKSAFGEDASIFKADRYLNEKGPPQPLTFGAGVKKCPGQGIVRLWLREMAACVVGRRSSPAYHMQFDQEDVDEGVKSFLGWLPVDEGTSWQGVKQLPTQRPRKAIHVIFAEEKT